MRSAVSRCSDNSCGRPAVCPHSLWLAAVVFIHGILVGQLSTGAIEGKFRAADGRPMPGAPILITAGAGFRTVVYCDTSGEFALTLPYGQYRLSGYDQRGAEPAGAVVFVPPLQIAHVDLVVTESGETRAVQGAQVVTPGIWTDDTRARLYPEGFSLAGLLLSREPASVTEPLDFGGLTDNRLALESQRGFSWTATRYRVHGMDATDSYQPGRPAVLPDVQTVGVVLVHNEFAPGAASGDGTEAGIFLSEPGCSWHGALSTTNTGAALSSTNLPPPAARGLVRQADQFLWFTRDGVEIGGPLARWADFYAAGSGQWSSQTEPLAAPGREQRSRLLFGTARGRIRGGERDRFDALYSGSRINLSDGGVPAGLEAFTGNRTAPVSVPPSGFPGGSETDHLDFLQLGWTHLLSGAVGLGALEIRYGFSAGHLDTATLPAGYSRVEILDGSVTGAPPLANLAVRPRQEIAAAWQPPGVNAAGVRHQFAAGGGYKTSGPRNRFTTPSDVNLITAGGVPAYALEFNTPLNSRETVRSFSAYFSDHISLMRSLRLDVSALADFSRGSLPGQSSPPGHFAPERTFAAQPDLIVWNSISPRAGFAWQVPHVHGLTFRASYSRLDGPLAGRYLDFGNPNALGGSAYRWVASNAGEPFQSGEQGNLLLHFGGPYSSISPALRRPYSDEFNLGAEFSFARRSFASIHLFRRDEKDRVAAIDTGLPASAFTPVSIADPGPDGIPGTFDDQQLTVYAQNPATLGQDRYLLTNPAGLRALNTGLLAEVGAQWRQFTLHTSFMAAKSYGPTNPGNAVYENDPGVLGALYTDPNAGIHATGRSFFDRAYVGKIQAIDKLPSGWGGIEVASVAGYMDGLVFARRLLVTGLPQGPFLAVATVRGSPGGGNRAQYAINWNLRFSRQFQLPLGKVALYADILNVTNAGQKIGESDRSGLLFNLRLPVAIQSPRFVRAGFRFDF